VHCPELAKSKIDLPTHLGNLIADGLQSENGDNDASDPDHYQCDVGEILRKKQFTEGMFRLTGMFILLPLGCLLIYYYDRLASRTGRILALGSGFSFVSIAMGLGFLPFYHQSCTDNGEYQPFHSDKL